MSKRNTIIVSILLIAAAIIIQVLISDSKSTLNFELIEFFTGILFGAGLILVLQLVIKKRKGTAPE